jgi:hypothetical protein
MSGEARIQVFKLGELVRRIDAAMFDHIEGQGLQFLQFAFRWYNCLMLREVPFSLVRPKGNALKPTTTSDSTSHKACAKIHHHSTLLGRLSCGGEDRNVGRGGRQPGLLLRRAAAMLPRSFISL